jgi:hypothetical protein
MSPSTRTSRPHGLRGTKATLLHRVCVGLMAGAWIGPAAATITFSPGTAFIQTDLSVGAPGGVSGTWTPLNLGLGTNVVEVNTSGTDVGGVKTTALDFVYNGVAADVGKTITMRWIVARPFNNNATTQIDHVDSLDGSVAYTGFTLQDITLRTITTQTDTDLKALHLGPLASGSNFSSSITNSSPSFVQGVGNDRVIQYFTVTYQQIAATGTFELILPNSASSAISAVPESSSAAMLCLGTLLMGAVVRRARARPV